MRIQEQIRELFKSNLDISCYDIANILSVDVAYANRILSDYFGNYYTIYDDLFLVEKIGCNKTHFLFSSFGEKEIQTDEDSYIINQPNLSEREQIWLNKNYGFKIYREIFVC